MNSLAQATHFIVLQYYHNMLLENEHQIDEDVYKMYFPLHHVLETTMAIYQELLGVRFERVANEAVWHPDVSQYQGAFFLAHTSPVSS